MKFLISALFCLISLLQIIPPAVGQDTTTAISGEALKTWMAAQKPDFQKYLATLVDEKQGYLVTGPLDALFRQSSGKDLFLSQRIVCADMESLQGLLDRLLNDSQLVLIESKICLMDDCPGEPIGYHGALLNIKWKETEILLQLNTLQQTRWLIWAHKFLSEPDISQRVC